MPLLIKNGEIITASERYVADIFCEGETITRIDRNLTAPSGTARHFHDHGRLLLS